MWWLFNSESNTWIVCVDHVPAHALNIFNADYPWLVVIKR